MGFTRPPCLHDAGELLPHHFNLTTALPVSAECFCCTFPIVTYAGRYPASCPAEPGLSSSPFCRSLPSGRGKRDCLLYPNKNLEQICHKGDRICNHYRRDQHDYHDLGYKRSVRFLFPFHILPLLKQLVKRIEIERGSDDLAGTVCYRSAQISAHVISKNLFAAVMADVKDVEPQRLGRLRRMIL